MPNYEFDVSFTKKILVDQALARSLPLLESAKQFNTKPAQSVMRYGWQGLQGRKAPGTARTGSTMLGIYKIDESQPSYNSRKLGATLESLDMDAGYAKIAADTGLPFILQEADEEDEVSLVSVINAAKTATTIAGATMLSGANFITGKTDKELLAYLDTCLRSLEPGWEIDAMACSSQYEVYINRLINQYSVSGSNGTITVQNSYIDPNVMKLLANVKPVYSRVWDHRYGNNSHATVPPYSLGYSLLLYATNKTQNPSLAYHKWIDKTQTVTPSGAMDSEKDIVHYRKTASYILNRKACFLIADAFKPA